MGGLLLLACRHSAVQAQHSSTRGPASCTGIAGPCLIALLVGSCCSVLRCAALQVYSADEAFVTGTFAGRIPVREVDGRAIGSGRRGPLVQRLQGLYCEMCDAAAAAGRAAVED